MINRLFKIICRDNQYAGFLLPRGEFSPVQSTITSEEDTGVPGTSNSCKKLQKVKDHDRFYESNVSTTEPNLNGLKCTEDSNWNVRMSSSKTSRLQYQKHESL